MNESADRVIRHLTQVTSRRKRHRRRWRIGAIGFLSTAILTLRSDVTEQEQEDFGEMQKIREVHTLALYLEFQGFIQFYDLSKLLAKSFYEPKWPIRAGAYLRFL